MAREQQKENDKKYDNLMSALIGRNPQAFLDFLYPGSRCVKHHRNKLSNTQRQPDAVIEAVQIQTGKLFLAQPEIQTEPDNEMAERLALYQVLLRWEYKKRYKIWIPVSSSVLHLTKAHKDLQVPLHWTAPGGVNGEKAALDFYFESVEMREKMPEEILRLGHLELLPLLPATEGGASHEIIEMMMERLLGSDDPELAYYGYTMAGLILKGKADEIAWLERRYKMLDEKFSASPVYQWTIEKGIAIGEERGKAAGIAIGKERGKAEGIVIGEERGKAEGIAQARTLAKMRKSAINIVFDRFPALVRLTNEIVTASDDPDSLLDLITNLAQAQSTEEAEQTLLKAQS
jgi:hypothetical protein